MTDSKTLENIINGLGKQTSYSGRKPIVVIYAGIATDENLKMLKKKKYDYMILRLKTMERELLQL